MPRWEHSFDVVAVGSGAAGLAAALTAHAGGLRPLVVERASLVGGSTMLAGGGMWVPANRFMLADGDHDSPELALGYLEALVGDDPPASTRARKEAFVRGVPRAIEFLESQGLRFRRTTGYPDYYPDYPGASTAGRGIESVIFDTTALGGWAAKIPPRRFPRSLPMGTLDVSLIVLARRTARGAARLGRIYAHHHLSKLRGQQLVGGGGALVSQLLYQALRRGIPPWLETRVVELVVSRGRVAGVVVERDGERIAIEARRAVHLGAGGFARNEALRQAHQPAPITANWTSAQVGDLGDGLELGRSVGAATALLDEAWWGPSSLLPGGPAIFHVSERSKPGSLIVDQSGRRYLNESIDYVLAGQTMFERHREVPAIPSYLVFDQRYRNRYPFGVNLPGRTPPELVENGYFNGRSRFRPSANCWACPRAGFPPPSRASTGSPVAGSTGTSTAARTRTTPTTATHGSGPTRVWRRSSTRPTTRWRCTRATSAPRAGWSPTSTDACCATTAARSPACTPRATRRPR